MTFHSIEFTPEEIHTIQVLLEMKDQYRHESSLCRWRENCADCAFSGLCNYNTVDDVIHNLSCVN